MHSLLQDRKGKLKRTTTNERLVAISSDEAVRALLQGDLYASRKISSKLLRLFISSTFCDTKAERKFLMRDTFPKIRDFCAKNGLGFMAIDLGWGQADASLFDHHFSSLCLEEMLRSKNQSLSSVPFVLHILTNKYGMPGLPDYLEKYEYQYIISSIEDEVSREMIEGWYIFDGNVTPPAYRLKGIAPTETLVVSPGRAKIIL